MVGHSLNELVVVGDQLLREGSSMHQEEQHKRELSPIVDESVDTSVSRSDPLSGALEKWHVY